MFRNNLESCYIQMWLQHWDSDAKWIADLLAILFASKNLYDRKKGFQVTYFDSFAVCYTHPAVILMSVDSYRSLSYCRLYLSLIEVNK